MRFFDEENEDQDFIVGAGLVPLDYFNYGLSQVTIKDGLWLEFGVYCGSTIEYIAKHATSFSSAVYGFDSFYGLSENWQTLNKDRTEFQQEHFTTNGMIPKELEDKLETNKNIRIVKGYFEDTLPKFISKYDKPCSYIHIDCDLYSSTKTILRYLRPLIVLNTIIMFDEYYGKDVYEDYEMKAWLEENREFEYIAATQHKVTIRVLK